ncbi:hypothetical protein GWK48_03845 [Metallosphaera tengchongensis]|uniref:B3/B4 tRNA-binding domain-containing protein n=2 Tax=Metallosphaera tengchongensis TaxID=1532350 RepID=A0A6N0NXQ2_9CREN|nr:hypothetical protein GWK48_03845 [Metallosphaera tengchongensis]
MRYKGEDVEKLKDLPIVRAYRDFYWKIGIDPTKVRPSGEALRRRITRGNPLPRINDVVDAGNVVSADTLISIGLYDLSKVVGEPRIVMSKGGEAFRGIGNKDEVLRPNVPIMMDESGQVMHIYPHRDSVVTSVTLSTEEVLIVGAGVRGIGEELVKDAVERTTKLLKSLGGKVVHEVRVN